MHQFGKGRDLLSMRETAVVLFPTLYVTSYRTRKLVIITMKRMVKITFVG
jgi:hypothetical protein